LNLLRRSPFFCNLRRWATATSRRIEVTISAQILVIREKESKKRLPEPRREQLNTADLPLRQAIIL
jgi:hypothetical protein